MNYYIDFDHTLFDSQILTQRMLQAIVKTSKLDILDECKSMFNRENIYNIYELVKYFSKKYHLDEAKIQTAVNYEINNSQDLVFPDGINFIKNLKEKGHKVYLLSYYEYKLQYQIAKIVGSHLSDLLDGIFVTKDLKYNLDINYQNGIFIDDKPSDLIGLYSKNPQKVIRIRRKNHKYSDKDINIDIEEYENFNEINI